MSGVHEYYEPGQYPEEIVKSSVKHYRPPFGSQRVYIAGPMSGYLKYNYPAFHKAAQAFRAAGCEVMNPAEHDLLFGPPGHVSRATYLRQAMLSLGMCDAIYLLPGWEASGGARLELHLALELELLVYELPKQEEGYYFIRLDPTRYYFDLVEDYSDADSPVHTSLVGLARDLGSRLRDRLAL